MTGLEDQGRRRGAREMKYFPSGRAYAASNSTRTSFSSLCLERECGALACLAPKSSLLAHERKDRPAIVEPTQPTCSPFNLLRIGTYGPPWTRPSTTAPARTQLLNLHFVMSEIKATALWIREANRVWIKKSEANRGVFPGSFVLPIVHIGQIGFSSFVSVF